MKGSQRSWSICSCSAGCSFLVELSGGSVVLGTFLAGNETLELQGLSGLHDGGEPLGDTSLSHPSSGEVGLLLGDNLAGLALSEVLLTEATGGSLAGTLPDLPLLADLGDSLGLLGLSLLGGGLLRDLLGRSGSRSLLGFLSSFSLSTFTGHFSDDMCLGLRSVC